jgi:hypothetical protein
MERPVRLQAHPPSPTRTLKKEKPGNGTPTPGIKILCVGKIQKTKVPPPGHDKATPPLREVGPLIAGEGAAQGSERFRGPPRTRKKDAPDKTDVSEEPPTLPPKSGGEQRSRVLKTILKPRIGGAVDHVQFSLNLNLLTGLICPVFFLRFCCDISIIRHLPPRS